MQDERVAYSRTVADEDGIGGAVVDNCKGIKGFIANSPQLDNPQTHLPENFANLKAQCGYKLADLINTHKVAISIEPQQFISEVPGITFEVWREQLIEEIEQIKSKNADQDRKLRIMPKDEVKETLGRSPDFSDTLLMRMMLEYKMGTRVAAIHYAQSAMPTQDPRLMSRPPGAPPYPGQQPRTAYTHVPRL